MVATVYPSLVRGLLQAPASKSAMQRACAAALIKGGSTLLKNPGTSADDDAALDLMQRLGATVELTFEGIRITSEGIKPCVDQLDAGESGLSVRMFTPIAAVSDQELTITGSGSLVKRPLDFFEQVLPRLGVNCHANNGLLPLTVKGPLQPADITVDGSLSSQFLTGLLFAYAAAGAADVSITVENLNSKPYIALSLQVMEAFGLRAPINENFERFYFPKNPVSTFNNEHIVFDVEGDWSGGAFLLVAGATSGSLAVKGLDLLSAQADKAIWQVLADAGVDHAYEEDSLIVHSGATLKPFEFDATDAPDLFPPLVALAAACEGISTIKGVNRLTHKESNRALTLQEEFGKMGLEIVLEGNEMKVCGGVQLRGATVSSRHDHRIAMACAVAALRCDGPVHITEAEAVNKSYPAFWQHLSQANANVSLSD